MFDAPGAHDCDPCCQGHRLDLVVRHIDDRGAELPVQALEFDAHLRPQFCVEVGEWFVEQKHLGVLHQCTADGDALALTTGKLRRLAIEQIIDL